MTTINAHDRTAEAEHHLCSSTQPALLTIAQAAALLAVGRTTLYELIATGKIEVIHIGRSVRVADGCNPRVHRDETLARLRGISPWEVLAIPVQRRLSCQRPSVARSESTRRRRLRTIRF